VAEYLSETSNFEGYMEDETDADRTTVAVGAEGNDGQFAFEPPAVQVTTETTIAWEWTGRGNEHNIVEESDYFSSGSPVAGADKRFELGIQESGTYLYYCRPHESVGMKGAIVVVDASEIT
jgi:halocyanin-like protein